MKMLFLWVSARSLVMKVVVIVGAYISVIKIRLSKVWDRLTSMSSITIVLLILRSLRSIVITLSPIIMTISICSLIDALQNNTYRIILSLGLLGYLLCVIMSLVNGALDDVLNDG